MTARPAGRVAVAALILASACGGGGGTTPRSPALTVSIGGAASGGRVTSAPPGIDCPGACSARFADGTPVTLTATASSGHVFDGWGGACGGTGPCAVTLASDLAVEARFDGPTDVAVTHPFGHLGFPLSLLPGESRSVLLWTVLERGAAGSVTLSVSGLPAGVTGGIAPPTVPSGGGTTLSVVAAPDAPPTPVPLDASLVASTAYGIRSAALPVEVRSPRISHGPVDLAYETDGVHPPTSALVLETVPGYDVGRLVRIDLASLLAVRTVATGVVTPAGAAGIGAPRALDVNVPATHALVAHALGLTRVDLRLPADQAPELPAPSLGALGGVRWETPSTALVTECGEAPGCAAGRLSRVDLDAGAVTRVTTVPLDDPAHVLRAGAVHVAERGAGRVVSIADDGTVVPVAVGLDRPTSLAPSAGGGLLATEEGGRVSAVGPHGGPVPYLDLPFPGGPLAVARSPWSVQEALVASRDGGRVARLRLLGREPTVSGPAPGAGRLWAPRAFLPAPGGGHLVTDCGPGGEAGCAVTGRLVRLSAGVVTEIVTGLADPHGLASDPGDADAFLVAERAAGRLLRVHAATGAVEVVASGLAQPWGVTTRGTVTALVSAADGVHEVHLYFGTVTPVAPLAATCGPANHGRGIAAGYAFPPGGGAGVEVAWVAEACPPQVTRVTLATGERTPHPLAVSDPRSVHGWYEPVVVDAGQGGRIFGGGVAYASGLGPVVDGLLASTAHQVTWLTEAGIAEAAEWTRTSTLLQGLDRPTGIALEPSGTGALLVDCGGTPGCEATGRLLAIDLVSGASTTLWTGLTAPAAVARESPLRVLVADCETAASCAASGRLSRVEGAERTTVAGGLADPAWVAVEPSGETALVAERAGGAITRVDLGTGAKTTVAGGLRHPRQVVLEGSGAIALAAEDGRVVRVDLATGAVEPEVSWEVHRFVVLPPYGHLGMLPRPDAPGPGQLLAVGARLTGAVEVWGAPLLDAADTAIWVPALGRLVLTERRSGTGAVSWITPP
jgi:hypothetical protein